MMREKSPVQRKEPEVSVELAEELGLTPDEFGRACSILGRKPTYTELGIFSVMWSEHCSYKNSIAELKKLPRSGGRLLVQAGEENAGLVDIGGGLAVAFKIESHNHPSAVEPYQGAATGVGGILRDIFTMGARPVAMLNSLRFGNLLLPRTQYLMKGIVKGIGDYGNSFGVPTVAGDVFYDECYDENPLVNAMAVGIARHEDIAHAAAFGEGNIVLIAGSSTGRDGIHGATFASEEISDESEMRRPSVQVGDPFTEKRLLESTLEAIRQGLVVGIQDMGAAGITCSTSEMCARGKSGMTITLDLVPVREEEMSGYEIMLSESQERMLLVVKRDHELRVREIFRKWDLQCCRIGDVTAGNRLRVYFHDELIADIPAESLVLGGGAPVYHRESRLPAYVGDLRDVDHTLLSEPEDYNACLLRLLSSPNIGSRSWITGQYDSMVRTDTVTYQGSDAAVIRIKGTKKALAMKTDCNPRYVYLNPYVGAQIAVAESARNVVCVGATPIAITNCLNFGNPYKPEIFWQFQEAIRGISDACKALETPVTGGNVSFYNENKGKPIYPTPVIGMLGLIESMERPMTACFKNIGDRIMVLGETRGEIGGSEYLRLWHGRIDGDAPPIDLRRERLLQQACLTLIQAGLLHSVHDMSEGGLAVALAECCILASTAHTCLGAEVYYGTGKRDDFMLFGEDQSRIVVSASIESVATIKQITARIGVPMQEIGTVVPDIFKIGTRIRIRVAEMRESYMSCLAGVMRG